MSRSVFVKKLAAVITLGAVNALAGQSLPQGRVNQIRERRFDIIHYKAELGFDMERRQVSGRATLTLRPLETFSELQLDAIRLDISGVVMQKGASRRPLEYANSGRSLQINLAAACTPRDTLVIEIDFSARPDAGLYFLNDWEHPGQLLIYSWGEGGLHANWLPIYSDVNDRFTTEMVVTVPPPYTVISNGVLLGVSEENGLKTFHWRQQWPHSSYLLALYVGEFVRGELPPAFGEIPLAWWVRPGRLAEAAYTFRNTTRMVEFFSHKFGYRYPWEKYDQIAFPDYAIGAMEHTSVTGHRESVLHDGNAPERFGPPDFDRYCHVWPADGLISHELVHHWFGNLVTCRSLNHIWLNESFGTYGNMLWDEEYHGRDYFDLIRLDALDRYFGYVAQSHMDRPLEYDRYDTPSEVYIIEITYFKGALVLHMLRNILGDDDFFRTLSHYLHKHEYTEVISSDFLTAIAEVTGKNLEWFFADWIHGAGYPVLEISYRWLADKKLLDISVAQIQPVTAGQGLFTLPMEITIATPAGQRTEKILVQHASDHFLLPCEAAPLMVSCDGRGALVAEIRCDKPAAELIYQIQHDALPGKIRALRQLAARFPAQPQTLEVISAILDGEAFWGLKSEAALALGKVGSAAALPQIRKALQCSDYRIRKAAVLALPHFPAGLAAATLKNMIAKDRHTDVAATAIVALARCAGDVDTDFIRQQLGRPAWYDEITLACLKAFALVGDPGLIPAIEPYTGAQYHEHLRNSAFDAWKSSAPQDPRLHRLLLACAESSQPGVRPQAISLLGELYVAEAAPLLEKIRMESGDPDLVMAAGTALQEIRRINGGKKPAAEVPGSAK